MVRLGQDRGRTLLIEQKADRVRYAVSEADFIEGAYDPEHYTIVGYNEPIRRAKLDEQGNALMYPPVTTTDADGNTLVYDAPDTPVMETVYPEVPDKEIARLVKASAEERKDAHEEAREIVAGTRSARNVRIE